MQLGYEKLDVTKLVRDLVTNTYSITGKWPMQELGYGGLGHQARRSSVSVSLNIAEGSAGTNPDFARFVRISIRSLLETKECMLIGESLGYEVHKDIDQKISTLYSN
ncbi:MAG: four helix bundle protein [Candidatus Uhrbacteria bacterium]|nr:four helix bundle protein [Candidatus Uhrbacteria bacterium]